MSGVIGTGGGSIPFCLCPLHPLQSQPSPLTAAHYEQEIGMLHRDCTLKRRDFVKQLLAGTALLQTQLSLSRAWAEHTKREVFVERAAEGTPHKGKVLLAVQAHSDDIPLMAPGTVAKLVKEGYTGYLVRATNDDMGDAPGLGTAGTIGEHVLGNERNNAEVARVLGLKKVFDFNYPNHRMA